MKKIALIFVLALTVASVSAQKKGEWWLGGQISYSATNTTWGDAKNKIRTFFANPYAEYFVCDNWGLYFGPGIIYQKRSDLGDYHNTLGGAFVGITRYFRLTGNLYAYAEAGMNGFWGGGKDDMTRYSSSQYGADIRGGLAYNTGRLSIFAQLVEFDYQYTRDKDKNDSSNTHTSSSFGAGALGTGLTLGLSVRLGK